MSLPLSFAELQDRHSPVAAAGVQGVESTGAINHGAPPGVPVS